MPDRPQNIEQQPINPLRKANWGEILKGSYTVGNALKNSAENGGENADQMKKNKELAKVVTTLNDIRKTSNIENALARLNSPDMAAILWNNLELRQYVEGVLQNMAAIDHQEDLQAAKDGNTVKVTEALVRNFGGVREGMQRVSLDLGLRLQEADPFSQPTIAQLKSEVDNVNAMVKELEKRLLQVEDTAPAHHNHIA